MKSINLLLVLCLGLAFCPGVRGQLISIQGVVGHGSGPLFGTNDTFSIEINLNGPGAPWFNPGAFLFAGSTGKLIFKGETYNFDSTLSYVGGYTSANVTQGAGNVTGMDFNLVFSGSPIGRIHGELYSLYPDNQQITDSGGVLLPGIPLTEFGPNPWNVIDLGHFGSDGSYTWQVTSYSAVPEPSTFAAGMLLLGGCAGNLLRRNRQRKAGRRGQAANI